MKSFRDYIIMTIVSASLLAGLVMPPIAMAQPKDSGRVTEYTLLEPLPCIPSKEKTDSLGKTIPAVTCNTSMKKTVNFEEYVRYVFNLIIAISAVLAVLMIVTGGFMYVSSDSFQGKKDGLQKVQNAVYGLVLVLSSYLILKTLDPRLVQIPSTLVEPIKIKCASNPSISAMDPNCRSASLSSYLEQVSARMNRYDQEYRQQVTTWNEAKVNQIKAQTIIDETNKKLNDIYEGNVSATQKEIDSLMVERQKALDQYKEAQIVVATTGADVSMRESIKGALDPGIGKYQLNNYRKRLENAWNKGQADLDDAGVVGYSKERQLLDDVYYLANGEIAMKEQIAGAGDNYKVIPDVKRAFDENYDSIEDPQKKVELLQSYEATVKKLCEQASGSTNNQTYSQASSICGSYGIELPTSGSVRPIDQIDVLRRD